MLTKVELLFNIKKLCNKKVLIFTVVVGLIFKDSNKKKKKPDAGYFFIHQSMRSVDSEINNWDIIYH